VDAIATDHAPWHLDEKDLPFPEAPFGIPSLECAFAAVYTEWLARAQPVGMEHLLSLFTKGPASILPNNWSDLGVLAAGNRADLVVIDTDIEAPVLVSSWRSKARISAWEGKSFRGWPVMAFVEGRPVYNREGE